MISPVRAPLSEITFGDTWKALVALWVYIQKEKLLFEMKFAVFGNGKMVAWGKLLLVDRPGPGPGPPMSISMAVGTLPTGVVERDVSFDG